MSGMKTAARPEMLVGSETMAMKERRRVRRVSGGGWGVNKAF